MGGFGSGRNYYATTPDVEACRRLDSDDFSEMVEAADGSSADISWGDDIRIRGYIVNSSDGDRADGIRLEYTAGSGDAATKHEYRLPFDYTEPNFGGVRVWFQCPRCQTRRGILYLPPSRERFACRECYDLQYRSSRDSGNEMKRALDRYRDAFSKADKHDRHPHPNDVLPTSPEKPKGMHQETFEGLNEDIQEAKDEWYATFRKGLEKYADDPEDYTP
jgi:hypothetical protein